MQIEGTREFFSKIASLNKPSVQNNTSLPGNTLGNISSPVQNLQKPATDTLFLSDIGKKLSLNANKAPTLTKKQEGRITDPNLKLIDQSMSQTKMVLERMHELTIIAQNKQLTDLDRVEIQIEIEDLRSDLLIIPQNLKLQSEGKSPIAKFPDGRSYLKNPVSNNDSSGATARSVPEGDNYWGNNTSLLSRMRSRIANKEEWDVREAWSPDGFSRIIYNEDGEEILEIAEEAGWYVVDDQSVLTQPGVGVVIDTGKPVPTVREILEMETSIIVMDAESAANGTKLLEEKINSVQKWLDGVAKISASEQSIDTTAMLNAAFETIGKITVFDLKIPRVSLNEPDIPDYFVSGNRVKDYPGPTIVFLNPPDVSSDKNTDGPDGFTNKVSNYNVDEYVDTVEQLSGEILEGVIIPKQPKTVYIKGL